MTLHEFILKHIDELTHQCQGDIGLYTDLLDQKPDAPPDWLKMEPIHRSMLVLHVVTSTPEPGSPKLARECPCGGGYMLRSDPDRYFCPSCLQIYVQVGAGVFTPEKFDP